MRINAHCHIFNLQSVFTKGTKNILEYRLKSGLGEFSYLLKPLLDLLERYLDHGGGLDLRASREERAAIIGQALDKKQTPKEILAAFGKAGSSQGSGKGRGVLKDLLKISLLDAHISDVSDIMEFMGVALAKDMDQVTDYLFDSMAEGQGRGTVDRGELIIFPLMMDILSRDWTAADEKTLGEDENDQRGKELEVFDRQREGTLNQCRRHPGRVLPFYAVNPWRPDWLPLFKAAMEEGGFVGLKAYPSLGYEVKQIKDALVYCVEKDIPVVTHCNNGGFKADNGYARYCRPLEWRTVIESDERLRNLKLCFGHFGGEEAFKYKPKDNTHFEWAIEIVEMMSAYPNIYGDVSYHTGGMSFSDCDSYFRWLDMLLTPLNGPHASRVLFGTDFFLVLQRISEDNYWDYFLDHMEGRKFEYIARKNPVQFIGLNPDMPCRSAANILRHLKWLEKQQGHALWCTGGKPANWLLNVPGLAC